MNEELLFDDYQGLDEILALIMHEAGPDALRELLLRFIDESVFDKEQLMDAAHKLGDAGLSEGAAIIRKAAEGAASRAIRD